MTLGHLDLVERALHLFERVTIAVAHNAHKRGLFGAPERVQLVRAAVAGLAEVEVVLLEGLVVDACEKLGADVIVRGVRSGTDFDYEVQMARTNKSMRPSVDTILLAPDARHAHISSSLVREIASLHGDASAFVPPNVARVLRERFRHA